MAIIIIMSTMTRQKMTKPSRFSVPDFCVPDGQLSCAAWSFWRASKSVEMISDEAAERQQQPLGGRPLDSSYVGLLSYSSSRTDWTSTAVFISFEVLSCFGLRSQIAATHNSDQQTSSSRIKSKRIESSRQCASFSKCRHWQRWQLLQLAMPQPLLMFPHSNPFSSNKGMNRNTTNGP